MSEVILLFTLPLLIVYLQQKSRVLHALGAVTLCYALGFALALLPVPYDKALVQAVASAAIAAAIPLILMGLELQKVKTLARPFSVGFALQIASVFIVSVCAFLIARSAGISYAPQLSGMALGLYIGGTPNLIAIGSALLPARDSADVIAAANTADILVGGCYMLFVLTGGRALYRRFLGAGDAMPAPSEDTAAWQEYRIAPLTGREVLRLFRNLALALAILGVGAGLEILISGDLSGSLYLMITVSLLGLALSFLRGVREVRGSYQLGQYLVLVFSLGLSMSIDFRALLTASLPILFFFALAQSSVAALHLLLCRLWKIDAGTALITSIAGIYGPPFIAPAAAAYGERRLVAPGVICGVFGLGIGNLLGILVGLLLSRL